MARGRLLELGTKANVFKTNWVLEQDTITPAYNWLIQEDKKMSQHDYKVVDLDVKNQH